MENTRGLLEERKNKIINRGKYIKSGGVLRKIERKLIKMSDKNLI